MISEALVDGALAAFHGVPAAPRLVAEALTARLPAASAREIEQLLGLDCPGVLFPSSAFVGKGTYVRISSCDERCLAGEITITVDGYGPYLEISGEPFTLRRR